MDPSCPQALHPKTGTSGPDMFLNDSSNPQMRPKILQVITCGDELSLVGVT